jgi:hypothetical protein
MKALSARQVLQLPRVFRVAGEEDDLVVFREGSDGFWDHEVTLGWASLISLAFQVHQFDRNPHLTPDAQSPVFQHFCQNHFVNGFQQPWPSFHMQLIGTIHDDGG